MLRTQITIPQWVSIAPDVRQQLVSIFNLSRSGGREVTQGSKGQVISDGHTHKDLEAITVEKMQSYLGSMDTDFYLLFDQVLKVIAHNQKQNINDIAIKVETENLGKWMMILRDMKNKATELNLLDKFTNLASEILSYEKPLEGTENKVTKGRGKKV